jgi:hypothetical protein
MSNSPYACESCGSHDLIATHRYETITTWTARLACRCEERRGELAAERGMERITVVTEWGPLDDNNRLDRSLMDQDSIQEPPTERYTEVYCRDCMKRTRNYHWQADDNVQTVTNDASHVYELTCGGCKQQLEHQWS